MHRPITNSKVNLRHLAWGFLLLFILGEGRAFSQTTQFTYQGKLADNGTPANGTYDIQFTLFDSLAAGNQVGSPVTNAAVSVANGIFTVLLDFGSSSFPGGGRFLEIGVRPAGSGDPYTVLSPRQPFTSIPYAIRALNAASADALSSACIGCVLSVTGGSSPFQNSNTFAGLGAGASTTPTATEAGNLNSFFGVSAGHSNTLGGENTFVGANAGYGNLTGQGNSFFGDFSGNSNTAGNNNSFFGSGAGYSSTGSGNSFFGQQSGNSNSSGATNSFFGIHAGIASTQGNNNTFLGASAGVSNTLGGNNTLVGSVANVGTNNLTNATAIGANSMVSQSNSLVLGAIKNVNGAAADTYVGIGTTAPGSLLTVSSNAASLAVSITNSGSGNALSAGSIGGNGVSGTSGNASAAGVYGENTAGGNGVLGVSNQSNGVGVTAVKGLSNGGSGRPAQSSFIGVWGDAGDNGVGLFGTSTGGWGLLVNCTSCASTGVARFQGGNVIVDGKMGIGTTTPSASLDVENTSNTDSLYVHNTTGYAIHARSETNYAGYFEGYTYFANLVFLPVLGSAGITNLCRNASNQIGTCSSSLRYKTAVTPFAGSLDIIDRLRPIQFDWKDAGTHDLGLAAEDVEKIEPLLVTYNKDGQVEGVKYDRIGVVLINAVKAQQELIEKQQKEIELQQQQIKRREEQALQQGEALTALQQQIEALKGLVCQHSQAAACQR